MRSNISRQSGWVPPNPNTTIRTRTRMDSAAVFFRAAAACNAIASLLFGAVYWWADNTLESCHEIGCVGLLIFWVPGFYGGLFFLALTVLCGTIFGILKFGLRRGHSDSHSANSELPRPQADPVHNLPGNSAAEAAVGIQELAVDPAALR